MKIVIRINDVKAPEVLLSIAVANGWPRDVMEDTVERLTAYMMRTVAQWTASGKKTLAQEAAEEAKVEEVSEDVTITFEA